MPVIAEGKDEVIRVRTLMIHQGLCMEEKGMRMTGKAPTCLSICKREFGFKGSREKIRRQLEAKMRTMGGFEDYLARKGLPTDMSTHMDALTDEATKL